MRYESIKQTSERWGISARRIQILCKENRIPGTFLVGNSWAIPDDAEKPKDERIKSGKYINSHKHSVSRSDSVSKQRLKDYGEFFTPELIVNNMLNMVDAEMERLDSRFLEAACGTGNFLVPVLKNKLSIAKRRYKNVPHEYEQMSILAISSVYGIELLTENVFLCRDRIFSLWEKEYKNVCKEKPPEDITRSAQFIIRCNIVQGDALTMKNEDGEHIVLSEWSFIRPRLLQRTEYLFRSLSNDQFETDSVLLKKYVTDFRRIWENVD